MDTRGGGRSYPVSKPGARISWDGLRGGSPFRSPLTVCTVEGNFVGISSQSMR